MQKLSHKQRVLNAIARKSVEKHPVQIDFSPLALEKYLKYKGMPVKNEEQLLEVFDNHIVYAFLNDPFRKTRRREKFGNDIIFDEWSVGWNGDQEGTFLAVHPLQDLNNYNNYKFPDPESEELMEGVYETIKTYRDEFIVSSYQVLCLFERCWALRGFENFMMDMLVNKSFAEELLDLVTQYQVLIAKRWIKMGINCGRTGDDYGMQNGLLMNPQTWREMIKPRLKKIWDVYKEAGLPLIHHSCGDVRLLIPDFIEMGLDVLNNIQAEAMPIEELADKYGEKLTFYGGISAQEVLPHGTPDDVRNEVKRVIKVLGRNRGLIIAPSVAITSDVSLENIIAFFDAINEFNVI